MGWKTEQELNALERRIVWRRGGPGKDFPCLKPSVIECAMWNCQLARCCELSTGFPGNLALGRLELSKQETATLPKQEEQG